MSVLIGLVGDVLVNRARPSEVFSDVRALLNAPDIVFANLESAYTDDPRPIPSAAAVLSAPAHNLDVYSEVGFDVLSLANNHVMDVGHEAMLETRARLRARGVSTCGAGESAVDAHEPAILDIGGLRTAFLAYASIFPIGCEARSMTPGLAPMRAYNFWREPFPTLHAPGVRPLITTVPDENDLKKMTEDILQARQMADLVIASFHWGDHTRSFYLTDHEIRTARYCIDHGADMVVGHHHHALRGMEWYKGKPIMYGLGHFVFDLPWTQLKMPETSEWDVDKYFSQIEFSVGPREDWPLLPMPEDTRMTVFAWAQADQRGIRDIGFLPCRLTPDGLVHPLTLDSTEAEEVIGYLEKCNRSQRLKTLITAEGSPLIAGYRTLRVVPG